MLAAAAADTDSKDKAAKSSKATRHRVGPIARFLKKAGRSGSPVSASIVPDDDFQLVGNQSARHLLTDWAIADSRCPEADK